MHYKLNFSSRQSFYRHLLFSLIKIVTSVGHWALGIWPSGVPSPPIDSSLYEGVGSLPLIQIRLGISV